MPAMGGPETSVAIGKTTELGNGRVRLTVKKVEHKPKLTIGKATKHERDHATVAYLNNTTVESVTIVPGPGYRGLTKLSRADFLAAGASVHHDGNEYDRAMVEANGYNYDALGASAEVMLADNADLADEVGQELEERRTLVGADIDRIAANVHRRRMYDDVEVTAESSDGERVVFNAEVAKNSGELKPNEWKRFIPDRIVTEDDFALAA